MIGIDTCVLVRYLVQDDPSQSREATAVIEGAEAADERIFLSSPVLCELAWVLSRIYRITRPEIVHVMETLLHQRLFVFENKDCVAQIGRASCRERV